MKRIIANLLTGWLSIFIQAIIALFMIPFLLEYLGHEGYGLIGLLGVLVSLSKVADLGLRAALGRELTEQVVRKNSRAFNELATSSLTLYLFIAIILSVTLWVLAPWLIHVFKVSPPQDTDAIWAIRVYGVVSVFFSFLTPVFSAGLASHKRYDLVSSIQIIFGLISSASLFVVIPLVQNPLRGWVAVMIITPIIRLLLMITAFRKFCAKDIIRPRYLNFSRLRPLFRLGGYIYMLQLTKTLAEKSDPLVISSFFGPAGVALYQPGGKLSSMIRPVVVMLSEQLMPFATQGHVENNIEQQKKILYEGTRFTLLLGTLFSVGIAVFAKPFCRLWLKPSLGENYNVAVTIMISWSIIDFTTYWAGTAWAATLGGGVKLIKPVAFFEVAAAIANITLSVYLVGYTRLGIPGVLVATALTAFFLKPFVVVLVARFYRLPLKEYLFEAHLRGTIVAAILLLAMIFIRSFCVINNFFDLFSSATAGGICWFFLCWWIGIKKSEKRVFKTKFADMLFCSKRKRP